MKSRGGIFQKATFVWDPCWNGLQAQKQTQITQERIWDEKVIFFYFLGIGLPELHSVKCLDIGDAQPFAKRNCILYGFMQNLECVEYSMCEL